MVWFGKKKQDTPPPPAPASPAATPRPRTDVGAVRQPQTAGIAIPADPQLAQVVELLNAHARVVATTNSRIRAARRQIAIAGGAPSFSEYTEDFIAGRASRTDAPWEWLLDAATRADELGEVEVVATIGQFVEFAHANSTTIDSPVDLADIRLWPMSARLLVPFADLVLPAVHELPADWRLFDGSGDSIDRSGELRLWSLAEQELVGVLPEASRIAAQVRDEYGLNIKDHPSLATLTRTVLANEDQRIKNEADDRSRDFAGCRDYARGLEALAQDDDAAAVAPLTAAAHAGHAQAAYHGGFAAQSTGDTRLMLELWELAARAGIAAAAFNYAAELEDRGRGAEAREWFERAGELGDSKGYAFLAALSSDDPVAHRRWSELGATAGNAICMGQLASGLFLEARQGAGSPDIDLISQARQWGERGGHLGDETAMFVAGVSAALLGERADAEKWLIKAHRAGHPNALELLRKWGR